MARRPEGPEWGDFADPLPEYPHPDLPSLFVIPEWDSAIAAEAVQSQHIAEAYRKSQSSESNQETRAQFSDYYHRLLKSYAKSNGSVLGIAHSKSGNFHVLHTTYNIAVTSRSLPTTPNQVLLWEMVGHCTTLQSKARRILGEGPELRDVTDEFFGALTFVLGALDIISPTAKIHQRTLSLVQRRIDSAERVFRRAAERRAQLAYCEGMGFGAIALVVLLLLSALMLWRLRLSSPLSTDLIVVTLAGAVAAVVSVMHRISFSRLELDYEAQADQLRTLGMFRPVIGAIFGVAIYCLVAGRILPLSVPAAAARLPFFAALAFLAGFSERWAQDMLVVAERTVHDTQRNKDGVETKLRSPLASLHKRASRRRA